jgi:hypothetical protein
MPGTDTLPNTVSLEFGESCPRIGVELGVGEEFWISVAMQSQTRMAAGFAEVIDREEPWLRRHHTYRMRNYSRHVFVANSSIPPRMGQNELYM